MNSRQLVLLGLVLLAALLSGCTSQIGEGSQEQVNATFLAVANGNTILDETIAVDKGTNAFEAMQQVADVGYEEHAGMGGVFVTSINGVSPSENQYWSLSVNGEESPVGIMRIIINEDITIEWRLAGLSECTVCYGS